MRAVSDKPEEAHSHVVRVGDLPLLVADDGKAQLAAGNLVDVLDPAAMALDGVGGETDELHAALGEFGLELGEGAQLGRADWRVVLGVGEEDNPLVADELVEINGAIGRLGLEVGGNAPETEGLSALLGHVFFSWAASRQQCKQHKPYESEGGAGAGHPGSPLLAGKVEVDGDAEGKGSTPDFTWDWEDSGGGVSLTWALWRG